MKFVSTLAIVICASLLFGCASYQVGSPSQSDYASVFVKPVVNDSSYPLLEASLTATLRKAINETGFLSTSDRHSADRLLDVRVYEADRERIAVQPSDVGRGKKFALHLEVQMSLYDLKNDGAPVFENRSFTISQDIFVDSDLVTANAGNQVDAEFQAGPEISRKIAVRVTESLTDLW